MILKNARRELFAQAIASGKSPSDAYVLAGFKPDTGNASKLNTNASVIQRVTAIQSAMAARLVKQAYYTREWVVEQLIDNVERAKEAGDFSAATSALRLLGVERTMFVDRKETGAPGDFAGQQSAAEVLAVVEAELGKETAALLSAALERREEASAPDAIDPTRRDADSTLQ